MFARLGQNLLMRKTVLKKCLYFVCFYKVDTVYWIIFAFFIFFFFDILLFFTGICFPITQNIMFSALKPKSKTTNWDEKTTNNKPSEYKPFHRSSTPYHLSTCESAFKFLLPMFLAITTFSFFIIQLMFLQLFLLQLLFPQPLFLLLPFALSSTTCRFSIWLTTC